MKKSPAIRNLKKSGIAEYVIILLVGFHCLTSSCGKACEIPDEYPPFRVDTFECFINGIQWESEIPPLSVRFNYWKFWYNCSKGICG
jgi:hypothetical protein